MPWVVGIDEAGYGPNLGPLVQAGVALRLPAHDTAGWDTLRPLVRRCSERAAKTDSRLLIDDSKKVYTRGGLAALQRGVLPLAPKSGSVGELFRHLGLPAYRDELLSEAWFDPGEALPLLTEHAAPRFGVGPMVAGVVPPPRFNRICDETGSKATVLSRGLVEIITQVRERIGAGDSEPVTFLCDKQGGRNYYAGMLEEAFPKGRVVAEKEAAEESRYRVEPLDRPVTISFRPRADGDSVAVALASMVCKYLRELCMRQFNRFWATHVPGIAPTTGYPVDAKRFIAEIRPAMEKLGLTDEQVWRKK